MQLKEDEDDLPAFDIGMTSKDSTDVVVLDYDSDGIDVIPEEDGECEVQGDKPFIKESSNLFTNLSNKGFEPMIKSNNSSPRRDTASPSTVVLSRCSTPDLTPDIFGPFPNTSAVETSAGAVSVVTNSVVSTPTIPVTTIVTTASSSVVSSGNTSEVLVNTLVNDNQIVLAQKISIFDLKIADIQHIEDKETRDWICYGILGMKHLKKLADHLDVNKIPFDVKRFVSEEFPPHLQYFDPLNTKNTKDLVGALKSDFINKKLKEVGNQFHPLLKQRGKRTKQYNYLIPHKAAAMRNTLLAVSVVKRSIDFASLRNPQVTKIVSEGSSACKLVRRDKRRRKSSSEAEKPRKKKVDQRSSLSRVPPAKDWIQPSSNNAIRTSVNMPSSNFNTNFMEDSDFLHLPKPSTKPISTPSLVKPPNSVSSQPIKQPATIKVTTKDSEKRAASPACTSNEPPDPLFVIGGNVRKPASNGIPKNSTPVAADKRKQQLSRNRVPSSKVPPCTKSIIIERTGTTAIPASTCAKEKVTKAVGLVSAKPALMAPSFNSNGYSNGYSTVVSTTKPTILSTRPIAPTTKPTVPSTRPIAPMTKPSVPTTKLTPLATKPSVPTTMLTPPTTKASVSTTKLTPLATKPTTPMRTANPTTPTSKPTGLRDKTVGPVSKATLPSSKPTMGQPTQTKHVEKPVKERVDAPEVNAQIGSQKPRSPKPTSKQTPKQPDPAVSSKVPVSINSDKTKTSLHAKASSQQTASTKDTESSPAKTAQNTAEPNPLKPKDSTVPHETNQSNKDKEAAKVQSPASANVASPPPAPSEERPSSPEVKRLPPRHDAPKRKQKELIPGIIWIKPEPGTNDEPVAAPAPAPPPPTPQQPSTKRCSKPSCKNFAPSDKDLCPVHQQKAALLEIRQMMINSGAAPPHALRNNSSAPKADEVPTSSPVPAPSETVTVRTQITPPGSVSANNPVQHPSTNAVMGNNSNPVRTRSESARALAHKNNPGSAPRNNPGSDVPRQFLPPARDLTSVAEYEALKKEENKGEEGTSPMLLWANDNRVTINEILKTTAPSNRYRIVLQAYMDLCKDKKFYENKAEKNKSAQADGPMIIRAITSYATVCPPTSHQFQSVGDFSFQRSSTLASLDKKDLENIKACRRNLGKSFDLTQLLQARACPIQSEIHLYILTVCIQDAIEAVVRKEKTSTPATRHLTSQYISTNQERHLSIYQLLNLLFNLIYTSEFEPVPVVLSWIEVVSDTRGHDVIRVMNLIEECFNLLQNEQLISFRFFLHYSFRSLVTFENVLDKRLPQMTIDDVSDKIIKLEEQGFCRKPPRDPELPDLQKFGVTGEFFLLRQYVAKCRESHPQEKFTKEFVASIIAHKMAVRGSSGGVPTGVSTAGPSRTRQAAPTPPATTRNMTPATTRNNMTPATTRNNMTPATSRNNINPVTSRSNPPVSRQLSHPPRIPTSEVMMSQTSPNMYTSAPVPTYTTQPATQPPQLVTNYNPQLSHQQQNVPQTTPYSHSVHAQSGQVAVYAFQGLTNDRIAMIAPIQQKRIMDLMVLYDKMQKDLSTLPLQHPQRPNIVNQLTLCKNELSRYEVELTRMWQTHQQALQLQMNSVPQQQQQQQQQHHQIPGAMPQQGVNWQQMPPSSMPPNSMPQSGPHTVPQANMPSRSNLVMSQQRIQQIQQLIKDSPQYNAAHHQPPNNNQLMSHNTVSVAYPQQPTTAAGPNNSGGVLLMNSQTVPQYQQQIAQQPQLQPQMQPQPQLAPQMQPQPPPQPQPAPQQQPTQPASRGPGRPRKKSSPKQKQSPSNNAPANSLANNSSYIPINNLPMNNPANINPVVSNPPTNNEQSSIVVDASTEKKPFTVQEPGKKERMEWMTQAEADELQSKLLEEYNRKKAEEQKKGDEKKKKAEDQKKAEGSNQAPPANSQSPAASSQSKKIPVISDERPKKKQHVVVIEVDSDDDPQPPASSSSPPPPAAPQNSASTAPPTSQPESSPPPVTCSTPTATIPPSVTSDNHVTSTTQSPGSRAAVPAHSEEDDERLLSGELPSNQMSYVNTIAELCDFENRNDTAIKEANERKRKAEEECERLNNQAARIKKRRQELLKRCIHLQTQTAADSDSELSIIDHTSVATPSTETLRINRGRIAPLSEAVKNIIKQ